MSINSPIFELFSIQLKKLQLSNQKVAVAVSGGADSLALALLTQEWLENKQQTMVALTVDHQLRPESSEEAEYVKALLQNYSIPHHTLIWDGIKPHSHIQESARQARYELLIKWCHENQYSYLMLGHHLGDQKETFLMRLMAGSGLNGLACMQETRSIQNIQIIRPLLKIDPARLKMYLKDKGVKWIDDPSNKNKAFLRPRLRAILNENKDVFSRLPEVIDKISEDKDFIVKSLDDLWNAYVTCDQSGFATFDVDIIKKSHSALNKRLIARMINTIGGGGYPPTQKKILQVLFRLQQSSFKPFTLGGCYWVFRQKKVHVQREFSAIQNHIKIENITDNFLWDKRFLINKALKAYFPPESIIEPLAHNIIPMIKTKINKKIEIPSIVWPTLPAIRYQGKIIAIPHLNYNAEGQKIDLSNFFIFNPSFIIG